MTHWTTTLIHSDAHAATGFASLNTPVYRGSTVVFPSATAAKDDWREEAGYTYGLFGTPTTRELGARIAQLERGRWTFLTPGGQASIALIYLAFADTGDHVLVPDSVYGPNREFATGVLRRYSYLEECPILSCPQAASHWCRFVALQVHVAEASELW